MEPWLHVLIPAYGPSPFLRQAIASLVAAADESTALTVVDDGTPGDDVSAITLEHAHVEYVRLDHNHGVAGAFQSCVDLSRGTYTVLMGSDDLVAPKFVSHLREIACRLGEPAMMMPGVTVIDVHGQPAMPLADRVKRLIAPRGQARLLSGDRLVASLLLGNWLYFPAMAWRTDLLREHGFRQDMQTALDLDLELRLLFAGEHLAWSPTPTFRYRRHAQSASSSAAGSGERFVEERALLRWAAGEAAARGWWRSRLAARIQPTSRAHALLASARASS